jgi:hypothetical protein
MPLSSDLGIQTVFQQEQTVKEMSAAERLGAAAENGDECHALSCFMGFHGLLER